GDGRVSIRRVPSLHGAILRRVTIYEMISVVLRLTNEIAPHPSSLTRDALLLRDKVNPRRVAHPDMLSCDPAAKSTWLSLCPPRLFARGRDGGDPHAVR